MLEQKDFELLLQESLNSISAETQAHAARFNNRYFLHRVIGDELAAMEGKSSQADEVQINTMQVQDIGNDPLAVEMDPDFFEFENPRPGSIEVLSSYDGGVRRLA